MDFKAYFDNTASTYDSTAPLMRRIACMVLSNLANDKSLPPITSESVIHDNAAGPGIFTNEIMQVHTATNLVIHATDYSEGMIRELRARDLGQNVHAQVMDSQALDFKAENFTHSYTGFALSMMPDTVKATKEIYRTIGAGGVAVVTSWYYVGWVDIVEKARRKVDPDGPEYKGPNGGIWAGEQGWKASVEALIKAGFEKSKIKVIDVKEVMKYSEWASATSFREMIEGSLASGWETDKREEFSTTHMALVREAASEETKGFEMKAWIVIAKK